MERVRLADGVPSPELSRLVYGVWRLADDPAGCTPAIVEKKIEACLELGITTFDHADIYGRYRSEKLFGAVLASRPDLRRQIELVGKCDICMISEARPEHRVTHYDSSPEHVRRAVEGSLANLRTDHLDLLLLHRPDPLMNAEETASELQSLVRNGKVLHLGVSNFTPPQLDLLQSRLDLPLVTNQIELSVLSVDALRDGTLDQSQRLSRRPMAWSALAGGALFGDDPRAVRVREALSRVADRIGRDPSQIEPIAVAWILRLPSGPLPILGTNRTDRIERAARACSITLERQDWFEIYEASLGCEVP